MDQRAERVVHNSLVEVITYIPQILLGIHTDKLGVDSFNILETAIHKLMIQNYSSFSFTFLNLLSTWPAGVTSCQPIVACRMPVKSLQKIDFDALNAVVLNNSQQHADCFGGNPSHRINTNVEWWVFMNVR